MPANRRNLYRLLHVQADAPAEVIKASYRALMAMHHPDKGGDHAAAVLVNEAYAVLSDPVRRATYDAQRTARTTRGPRTQACPMCRLPHPANTTVDARCARCSAPLGMRPSPRGPGKPEERRAMPRVSKADWAMLHYHWPQPPVDVRLRDLSLDGMSVYSGAFVPLGTTVRVVGAAIDAVGEVVSCRRSGVVFILHARLVSAQFATPRGGFVSTVA